MNNEIQKLDNRLIDMDKKAIQSMASSYIDKVNDGEIDALKAFIFAHKLEEFASKIKESLKDQIQGTKGEFNGLRISEVKAGSKFDYSGCGDPDYNEMMDDLENLKKIIKAKESFLKSLEKTIHVVDNVTGECHEIKPPINTFSITTKIEWI